MPIISFVLVWAVSWYFNSFKSSVPFLHLADVQYTHLAITENLKSGNGSILSTKSYVLDPQGGSEKVQHKGVGDARFPVVHEVISWFSFDGVKEQVQVWRVFTFCFFLIAIYFSSLLCFDLTENWLVSLLVSLGVNFTPVLFFAQWSVGTSLFVYALIITGIYTSFNFFKSSKGIYALFSVFFFGTAMLQGHGSFLYLSGFCVLLVYSCVKNKTWNASFFLTSFISVLFVGLFVYYRFVVNVTGGGFLEMDSYPGIISLSFLEANAVYLYLQGSNVFNVFISCSLFLALFYIFFNFINKRKVTYNNSIFLLFLVLILVFQFVYYVFNVQGFTVYDVYTLESYMPVFIGLSVYSFSILWKEQFLKRPVFQVLLFFILVLSTYLTIEPYKLKFVRSPDNIIQNTLKNLSGADLFLDDLGMPLDEKITIINGYGGDMALMKAGRYGYVPHGNKREDFKRVLDFSDTKYILSQDEYFMFDVVNVYPEALNELELVASNQNLSLFKKVSGRTTGSVLKDYVRSHNKDDFYEAFSDFESLPVDSLPGSWTYNGTIEKGNSANGEFSMYVPTEVGFPCTYRIKVGEFKGFNPSSAIISSNLFATRELWKVCFTLSVHRGEKQLYNNTYKVSKKLKGDALSKWSRVSCKSTLPVKLEPGDEIRAYLWNPQQGEILLDDFSIMFY